MTLTRPDWHDHANCGRNGTIGDNPVERVHRMFTQADTTVCEGCPVQADCARAGRRNYQQIAVALGVWGGRNIGSRTRTCEICGDGYTTRTRAVTCSDTCATERQRRLEATRTREARRHRFADACCDLCGRVRHHPACPERARTAA